MEDAGELQFGSDFNDAEAMLLNEVYMMLESRERSLIKMAESSRAEAKANTLASSILAKTKQYCERFQTPNLDPQIRELRQQLSRPLESGPNVGESLKSFQIASIVNLQPDNAEEAKAIIPSLKNFENDEVEHFLKIYRQISAG